MRRSNSYLLLLPSMLRSAVRIVILRFQSARRGTSLVSQGRLRRFGQILVRPDARSCLMPSSLCIGNYLSILAKAISKCMFPEKRNRALTGLPDGCTDNS